MDMESILVRDALDTVAESLLANRNICLQLLPQIKKENQQLYFMVVLLVGLATSFDAALQK